MNGKPCCASGGIERKENDMSKRNEKAIESKIIFKDVEYLVSGIAYTLNEGEYYIAKRSDDDRNFLIPTDSECIVFAF